MRGLPLINDPREEVFRPLLRRSIAACVFDAVRCSLRVRLYSFGVVGLELEVGSGSSPIVGRFGEGREPLRLSCRLC